MLINWALKSGSWREHGEVDSTAGGVGVEDGDYFTKRVGGIRRRLLDVLDLDSTAVEV